MKSIYYIHLVCLFIIGFTSRSQQLPVDCDLAIPGCSTPQFPIVGTNPPYNTTDFTSNSVSNPSTNPSSGNSGCLLSGETVSTFITINVVSSGTLEWSIIGNAGGCFDWIMWESTPANGGCAGINGNTLPPVSCNWNGNCNGNTGMAGPGNIPPNGSQSSYEPALNVTAGQSFILCLSNYSFTNQNVNLNFFGTGGVSCVPSTPDQTICQGSSATVDILTIGMVNPTYNWLVTTNVSNPTGGTGVIVNPTQTTEYIVEITDGSTVIQDTFTIYVELPPTPNAGVDQIVCQGDIITLAGVQSQGGSTIGWTHNTSGITPTPIVTYTPNSSTANPNVSVNQPGTYTFTLTEDNGVCPAEMDQMQVLVSSTTHTTSWVGPSCAGMSDGSITITNLDAVEYSFDNATTWVTNSTMGGFPVGTYTVWSRNQYGCEFSSVVNILEPAQLYVYAGNDTLVCQNGTANLWATTSAPGIPMIYHWSHPTSGTTNTETFDPIVNTTIEVYAEGPNGCLSDTAEVLVSVRPPIAGYISPFDTICPGYPTTIGVFGLSDGIGAPFDIVWSTGDVGSGDFMDIGVNPPVTTTYTATITDACESTPLVLTTEVYVAPVPEPIMSVVDDHICEPAIFELINETDPAMVGSYVWNISDGQSAANESPYFTEEFPFGSYDVQLIVTSPLGCIDSITNYSFITSDRLPVADFNWSPNPVQMFNTDVNFQNKTFLGNEYYWTFEDGIPSYSNLKNPQVQFPNGVVGQYDVTLYVVSEYGCMDTITKVVIVNPEVLIYAPNTFTPDGDEFNQYWRVFLEGVDVQSFDLQIYNRWGEIVWESHDIEIGWDGTYNGKVVKEGTYIWKVSVRDALNDGKYSWNGLVNVLK